LKYGNLNFLEPSGPLQACNGTALPLHYIYIYIRVYTWRREYDDYPCSCLRLQSFFKILDRQDLNRIPWSFSPIIRVYDKQITRTEEETWKEAEVNY